MKKTISLALISLLLLSLSAIAVEYPIGYEDESCEYKTVEVCHNELQCHGHPYHCHTVEVCHNEMQNVCTTEDKQTSVDVPETDLEPVYTQLNELSSKGDKTGISKCDVWRYLAGEVKFNHCMISGYTFMDFLKPTIDKVNKVYDAIYGRETVMGFELGLQDQVRELRKEVQELKNKC